MKRYYTLSVLFFLLLWIANHSIVSAETKMLTQTEDDTCKIHTLPFTEGFDAPDNFTHCWQKSGSSIATRNTTNGYKAINSIRMTSGNMLVAAPMLDPSININKLRVKYALSADQLALIFEVGVMTDPTDATTFETVDRALISATGWNEYVAFLSDYTGIGRYIAFKVANSAGINYLDDITIEEAPDCVPVKNLRITDVGSNSLYLNWEAYNCHTSFFEVSYKTTSQSSWTSYENTFDTHSLIEGLASGEGYEIQVVANCEAGSSAPIVIRQGTTCLPIPVDTVGTPSESTNTSGRRIPTSLAWLTSYTQQIYKASDLNLNGADIKGFAMQYTFATAFTRNITIYVGHTTKETFVNDNDYIPVDDLTEVFNGTVNINNSGVNNWVDFIFQTPFEYDGAANLVIAIHDHTGNRTTDASDKFKTHQNANTATLFCTGSNTTIIDIANLGAGERTNYRNNIMFYSSCQSTFCLPVSIVKVSDITDTEANLTWVKEGNVSSFELEYKTKAETPWTNAGTITGKTHSLTNLLVNTNYNVRIRGLCGETPTSWTTVDFKTAADLTNCPILMLPYTENFEGFENADFPLCWNRYTSSYDNLPVIATDGGTKVMRFAQTKKAYSIAILPKVDDMLYLSDLQITFKSKTSNQNDGNLLVGVMDDPDKANTFTLIDTVRMQTTGWESFDTPFAEYKGTGKYIAFMWCKSENSNCVIDDITIDYASLCPRPAALNIDSINGRKVFFSWKDPKNSQWQVIIVPSEEEPNWDNPLILSQTHGSINNLKPKSNYTLYVMAECAGESSAIARLSFATPCGAIIESDLPYTETFDKYGTSTSSTHPFPTCWTRQSTSVPTISSTNSHSAPGALYIYYMSSAFPNVTMAAEKFDMNIATLQASFKLYGTSGTGFVVGAMTVPDNFATFTAIDTVYLSTTNAWEDYTVYLNKYPGTGQYLAFQFISSTTSTYTMYMDDLVVDKMDACPPPAQVEISDVTDVTATVTWKQAVDCNGWDVAYGYEDFVAGEEGELKSVSTMPYTITSLNTDTKYDVYIRAICDDGVSDWTPVKTFQTKQERGALPYQHDFEDVAENNRWVISNGDQTNKWYIDATEITPGNSSTSLYISNTDGVTNEYSTINTAISAVYAKRYFIFDVAGKYELTFDWRANGMADYDLLRVFVVPATTSIEAGNYYGMEGASNKAPNGWIDAGNGLLQLQSDWQHQVSEFDITTAGAYNLVFMWKNYRTGSNPPAAIDNISLQLQNCSKPTTLVASNVTNADATLTWTETGDATSWEIQYRVAGFAPGTETSEYASNTTHTLTNLSGSTSYEVHVRAICGEGDTSLWSNVVSFKTTIENTIPYQYDFEDENENNNWVLLNGNQNSKWYINTVSDNASNDTKVLYISSTNGATNEYNSEANSYTYAMRTLRFPSSGKYEFELDWKANGDDANDVLRVFLIPATITIEAGNAYGMTIDRNDVPTNWITLDGGPLKKQTTWQHLSGEVELDTAGSYNLVFFWKNNAFLEYQKPAAIDNIIIRGISCSSPVNLAITDVFTERATATWEESGTATTWEIQYAPEDIMLGQGTSVIVTGNSTYTFSGLLDATTYHVYVRAICGAGDTSRWSETATFQTRCNGMLTQIPYLENFDSYGTIPSNQYNVIPHCWSVSKSPTIANFPHITNRGSSYSVSRPNALNFNAADEGYSIAILPELDAAIDITNLQISFSGRSDVANKQGTFSVGVMDNLFSDQTFTTVQSFTLVSATHTIYTVSFADYAGTGRYIALKWEDAGMYNYSLDNLILDYITAVNPSDTCTRPHSPVVSNIEKNSVDIAWTPGGDETSWDIAYKLFSETTYTNTQTCTTPSLSLSSLVTGTGYDVRIRAICGDSKVSRSVIVSFTTLHEAFYTIIATAGENGTITPSDTVTVARGDNQNFTFLPDNDYIVKRILVNGASVGNANSYLFENVTENATIHVDFELEDTTNIVQHYLNNQVLIYPNPTQNNLKVKLSASFEQVEIMNLLGQVIYTDKIANQEFEVNVADYRSGVYFIRLSGKLGAVTRKFVKE